MNPSKPTDSYQPRWTNYHTQSTVWLQNPLDHDVVFNVADEHNNSYQYRLPSGKVSELPGGAVATLGVKAIVDELIQNNKNDVLRLYEPAVRAKYEDEVVLRIKEAPVRESKTASGEIDLSVKGFDDEPVDAPEATVPDEVVEEGPVEEFPGLKEKKPSSKEQAADEEAKNVAKATAGKLAETQVIEE